ncbi:MAG: tRNA lysidine(34) synthetase TilS [Patescibacteria group bacterium]|jgi:tRNA(Ile)-lysidine synthase
MKLSQKSLLYRTQKVIEENGLIAPGDSIIVAVSGGADSVCLLSVLDQLKDVMGFSVLAAHFDHRLRGEASEQDKLFVQKLTSQWGIELLTGEAPSDNSFKNEEEARSARYVFFEKIVGERRGAKVAIAHNANDLIETFLQRFVRGAGLSGLRSIPLHRDFFIRPLLPFSRSEIEGFLKSEGLSWRTDESNQDIRYTRNFIRHRILPLLLEINPNFIETAGSAVRTIDEDYSLLEELAESHYKKLLISESLNNVIISRQKLLELPSSLQRLSVRRAISKVGSLQDITITHLDEVFSIINKGSGGKYKLLPHSLRIELRDGTIIVSRPEASR